MELEALRPMMSLTWLPELSGRKHVSLATWKKMTNGGVYAQSSQFRQNCPPGYRTEGILRVDSPSAALLLAASSALSSAETTFLDDALMKACRRRRQNSRMTSDWWEWQIVDASGPYADFGQSIARRLPKARYVQTTQRRTPGVLSCRENRWPSAFQFVDEANAGLFGLRPFPESQLHFSRCCDGCCRKPNNGASGDCLRGPWR